MKDIFGSIRRSLVFPTTSGEDGGGFGGLVGKIGTSVRKSRIGLFSRPPVLALPSMRKDDTPPIRWRKGELIGCGAFGCVYMGMNVDSGELLAVKQVLIAPNTATKEKAQAHIQELEEEVKLLKNLSHPNIVRYLGTARENESLNILLEFVPGGSISSLLGKFGSFPESVIRMYTKQLLLGLEYLHKNRIMHRDIKGANILVDNKGCIKLADFGASKKVVELVTINGAQSMKGTPYWMAPEVICQTGHSFSADIWSVGCTVIEMATGEPPWSRQYQEVAALLHVGKTKSHPPIPEHLSVEATDFLLKCLQKEPYLRPSVLDLLQHPFVTGEYHEAHAVFRNSVVESRSLATTTGMNLKSSLNSIIRSTCPGLKDVCEMGSVRCSTVFPESGLKVGSYYEAGNFDDDMCQIDDKDILVGASARFNSVESCDLNKSFNLVCEAPDKWACKFDESPEMKGSGMNSPCDQITHGDIDNPQVSGNKGNDFKFPHGPLAAEDDDEVTESKIRAFLDEKALDLKKMQTPLYKEFYGTLNATGTPSSLGNMNKENITKFSNLPPKSKSPKQLTNRRLSAVADTTNTISSARHIDYSSNVSNLHDRALQEIRSPYLSEWKKLILDPQLETVSSSASFNECQRKWKEELDEELKRKREIIRQAALGEKASSLKD